jgi:hypothetical protein
MVIKIAEKIMSKNKSFLVLGLSVAKLLFSQTCSTKFVHVLTKTNSQQENNMKKVYRVQQQLCQAIAEIYLEL